MSPTRFKSIIMNLLNIKTNCVKVNWTFVLITVDSSVARILMRDMAKIIINFYKKIFSEEEKKNLRFKII